MLNKKFRQILSLLLCFILVSNIFPSAAFAAEGVVIDETTFPDAVFREYVIKKLANGDNILSQNEIEQTTEISVRDNEISNLKGIEYFSNLNILDCSDNQLTSLDLSNNTALKHLSCYDNHLTSLDLSSNTALTDLYCASNQLTSLNFGNSTALTRLECDNNQLTSLDFSKNTALTVLQCTNNQLILAATRLSPTYIALATS